MLTKYTRLKKLKSSKKRERTCLGEGGVDDALNEDERHCEGEELSAFPILALRSKNKCKNYN